MVCNDYASRGRHVSAKRDKGEWFCEAHWQMTTDGQEEIAARMRASLEEE